MKTNTNPKAFALNMIEDAVNKKKTALNVKHEEEKRAAKMDAFKKSGLTAIYDRMSKLRLEIEEADSKWEAICSASGRYRNPIFSFHVGELTDYTLNNVKETAPIMKEYRALLAKSKIPAQLEKLDNIFADAQQTIILGGKDEYTKAIEKAIAAIKAL